MGRNKETNGSVKETLSQPDSWLETTRIAGTTVADQVKNILRLDENQPEKDLNPAIVCEEVPPTLSIIFPRQQRYVHGDQEGQERAVHRINLSSLEHNYRHVESVANRQKCSVITVVKADGCKWRFLRFVFALERFILDFANGLPSHTSVDWSNNILRYRRAWSHTNSTSSIGQLWLWLVRCCDFGRRNCTPESLSGEPTWTLEEANCDLGRATFHNINDLSENNNITFKWRLFIVNSNHNCYFCIVHTTTRNSCMLSTPYSDSNSCFRSTHRLS